MSYGYKCPRCGEIVRYCNSWNHVKKNKLNETEVDLERELKEEFYCSSDGITDCTSHFCTKKCMPKPYFKKVKAKWGDYD
jgi:hypothetical protein